MGRRGLRVAAGPAKRGKGGSACPCRRSDPTAPPANAKSRGGLSLRSFDSSRTELARYARVVFRYAHVELRCAGRGMSLASAPLRYTGRQTHAPASAGRSKTSRFAVSQGKRQSLGSAAPSCLPSNSRRLAAAGPSWLARSLLFSATRRLRLADTPGGLCRGALWCPPDYDPTGPPAQELIRSVRRMSQPMLPRPRTTGCYVQSRKGRLPPAQHRRRDRI